MIPICHNKLQICKNNMKIKITGFKNRNIVLQLPDDPTLDNLLTQFQKKTGMNKNQLQIIYMATTLKSDIKLKEQGITDNCQVHCVFKLVGGVSLTLKIQNMRQCPRNEQFIINSVEIIYDVKRKVHHRYHELPVDHFILCYNGIELAADRTIASYGIPNLAQLTTIQGQKGEVGARTMILDINYNPNDDVLNMGEGFSVKMPCGHHISKGGMTGYINSLLQNNYSRFVCPGYIDKQKTKRCEGVWDPYFCMKVAFLNSQECRNIQQAIAKNYANKILQAIECKECHSHCYVQSSIKEYNVYCPVCAKDGKRKDFCRRCHQDWKVGHEKECLKYMNQILASSKIITFDKKKVPETRACPNCTTMIMWADGCKHMMCTGCSVQFCMVCLRLRNRGWECGRYNKACQVANIQVLK